jgi:hypothetical protein
MRDTGFCVYLSDPIPRHSGSEVPACLKYFRYESRFICINISIRNAPSTYLPSCRKYVEGKIRSKPDVSSLQSGREERSANSERITRQADLCPSRYMEV